LGLTISELARSAEVGVETVRYYQRRGLLDDPQPSRRAGAGAGRRHYGAADLSRLRFIRAAQRAGFTLDEVGELLELDRSSDRPRVRAMAAARLAELDRRIGELTEARGALARLADACASSGEGPCPIIEAFDD